MFFFLQIREATGCRIVFPNEQDDDPELITIIGSKEGVKQAKEELEAAIKEIVSFLFNPSVTVAFTRLYTLCTVYRVAKVP